MTDLAPMAEASMIAPASEDVEEVGAGPWQRLPRTVRRAWHIDNALGLIVALGLIGGSMLVDWPRFLQPWLLPIAAVALVAALVESCVIIPRRHACYRYRLRRAAVVVETGAVFTRQLIIPVRQVLYVEITQGPVLRAFGLARVRLGTIAEPKTIGPLDRSTADALRAAIEAEVRDR